MPNPFLWSVASTDFLRIYDRNPTLKRKTPIDYFDDLIYAGRHLADLHTGLAYRMAADKKYVVRRALFKQLLDKYQTMGNATYPELLKQTVVVRSLGPGQLPVCKGGFAVANALVRVAEGDPPSRGPADETSGGQEVPDGSVKAAG